jgi:hypothetical protein
MSTPRHPSNDADAKLLALQEELDRVAADIESAKRDIGHDGLIEVDPSVLGVDEREVRPGDLPKPPGEPPTEVAPPG